MNDNPCYLIISVQGIEAIEMNFLHSINTYPLFRTQICITLDIPTFLCCTIRPAIYHMTAK